MGSSRQRFILKNFWGRSAYYPSSPAHFAFTGRCDLYGGNTIELAHVCGFRGAWFPKGSDFNAAHIGGC